MPREYPLLLKPHLVVKTLKKLKTQTRRIIRPEWSRCLALDDPDDRAQAIAQSPYGQPGDILWVRETFAFGRGYDGLRPGLVPKGVKVTYAADGDKPSWAGRWRPSIHMPRWVSRAILLNKGVRIERIQEIPCHEIRAEGFSCPEHDFASGFCTSECPTLRETFAKSWDAINAKRGYPWKDNDYVFVVDFALDESHVHT